MNAANIEPIKHDVEDPNDADTKHNEADAEDLRDLSTTALSPKKSRSKSVVKIAGLVGQYRTEPEAAQFQAAEDKINEDALTRNSNKSARKDRKRTIECLNLQTKPRFQTMHPDMFRTFLTRKSIALELEAVCLQPDTSEMLVKKYPMLQGPAVTHQHSLSHQVPNHPGPASKASRSHSFPYKRNDEEKFNKDEHAESTRNKLATELEGGVDEDRGGGKEVKKHIKSKHKMGREKKSQETVLPINEEKITSNPVETSSEILKERGMLHGNKIGKTKKLSHKQSHKKKKAKSLLEKVASDGYITSGGSKAGPNMKEEVADGILDDKENPEWNNDNEVSMEEMFPGPEGEHSTRNQIVSEIMAGSITDKTNSVNGITKNIHETNAGDGGKENDTDEVQHALPDTDQPLEVSIDQSIPQKTQKIRTRPTVHDKGLVAEESLSLSFLNKSKDRIFNAFLKAETLAQREESIPRSSLFYYPSVTIVSEDITSKINPADTADSGQNLGVSSSRDLLPEISTNTARLLSIHKSTVVPKEYRISENSASPPGGGVHFGCIIDQKTTDNLAALTQVLETLKYEMDAGMESRSSQNASPRSEDENSGVKKLKSLPNMNNHDEFMKYFCSEWINPKKLLGNTPGKKKESVEDVCTETPVVEHEESNIGEDERSKLSEILDNIDDDEIYDLIFTYRLPKKAPFDLKDTVNEARFKCIFKWLKETGNEMYRTVFEEELKAKADEKSNAQLLKKISSLQKKIKRCDVCNRRPSPPSNITSVTSSSTFSNTEDVLKFNSLPGVEAPSDTVIEDISVHREAAITREMGLLARKLQESIVSYEDSEVLEKSVTAITLNKDENGDEVATESQVVMETRGARRRREIRQQLEKVIDLLQEKLKLMKTRQVLVYKGEDEEGELITLEKELSFKSCHCPDNEEECSSPPKRGYLESILQHFPINVAKFLKKRSACRKTPVAPLVYEESSLELSNRNRVQLYLLDYLDTWKTPDEPDEDTPPDENVEENRLSDIVRRNELFKRRMNPPAEEKSKIKENLVTLRPVKKVQTQKNEVRIDESKGQKTEFSCSCFCDRVSRFNPKRKQHFRPVLNEHFWCLRTDPLILDAEYHDKESSAQTAQHWSLCPPQVVEEADNFQGWLADTDRNLLLIMSRSPLDRIYKDYYNKITLEKKMQLPLLEEVDEEHMAKKKKICELINKLSTAHAERFWETVHRWYEDYKKGDKVRQTLEQCGKVDLNSMLQRDLTKMRNELAGQLEEAKEEVRIRVQKEKKKKFKNDVKKLRAAYSCRLKNRLEAKEKEMESKKEFLVRCMLVEAKENFAPVIEKYKKKCIDWIETLRDKQNATSLTVNQRRARELALIADKCDLGERVRRRLLGATGKEHEEVEKVLGMAIESRDITIERLKSDIVNLTRDVSIWKRGVGEVLKSFKKFVYYILETRPDRAQYVLSLEKLYQLQMDDLIRDARNELEKVETTEVKPTGLRGETLQPTMEIKCPSHDIRYASEHSGKTSSSAETDIDKDIRDRKVVDHAVDALIRTVVPTPELSDREEVEGEDDGDLKELEQLIALWDQNSQELKIEPVSSEEVCEEEETGPERLVRVIGEGASDPCISVEEFTKRRIREMLEIIARKKPLIRSHVHLFK